MSGSTQPSSLLANRALQGALNPTTTGPGSSRPVNGTVVGNSRGKRERDGDDVPMRDGGGGGPSRSGRGATGGARRGAIGSGQVSKTHNILRILDCREWPFVRLVIDLSYCRISVG